jgi:general nucleoside transport system permease protein
VSGSLVDTAFFVTWLAAAVRLSGPVLLASLGEIFAERSGVLNVGIEGAILLGALSSYLACYETRIVWAGFAAAAAVGLVVGVFLAFLYVTARASQVVVGIVFNVLAVGLASFLYQASLGAAASPEVVPMIEPLHIPWLSDLPIVGPILFGQTLVLYLTLALVAVAHAALFRTRFGLSLRAVGENPKAADAAGVHVEGVRYIGVILSSITGALAGAYVVLAQVGMFRDTIVAGQGFIALSIVIFGRWSPWKAAAAAFAFGAADALQLSLQLFNSGIPAQVLLSLPYVVTILAISGLFGGRTAQPAALMTPYVRN